MSIAVTAETVFATPTGAYAGLEPAVQPPAVPPAVPPATPPAASTSTLRPSMQQMVRNALHADALTSPSAERAVLERELDRLQPLIATEQAALGQQLNWTMLSQALLLNVFIVALVFGTALPGKRWLLAGIALFATVVAVLCYFAWRGARQSVRALLQRRAEIENSLDALGRQAVFAGDRITRGSSALAARLLPAAFVAGWLAVSIYALATPANRAAGDARVTVTAPATGAGAGANNAAAPSRPRGAVRGAPAASSTSAPPQTAAPSAEPAEMYSTQGETSQPAPPRRSGFKW